jgi:predicted GNAT family acetyltransferase
MEVKQKENGERGQFFIEKEGVLLAKMTYVWAGKDRIIIDHTEVDEALKGMGAGKQMVSKAVDFAREKGIKIVPLCPFARSVFDKVKEFSDVL